MGIHLKIKEERKRKGMTQEQLAEKIDVSTKIIVQWENGKYTPSLENLKKLRTVFGVTLDYLLKDNIELKSRYEVYVKLGRDVLELVDEEYPIDFFHKYYICSREPSLLIPKRLAMKFIYDIGERIEDTERSDGKKIKSIQEDMKKFLLFWYKYNKGKCLLSKELKSKMLLINSTSFDAGEMAMYLEDSIYLEKPILFLRNLMISRLIVECNLFDYELDERITEELDFSGEIMWPIETYK
ncbi:hypothetical protein C2D64_08480 [Listeria ivanovii]|uniref:helix-turn-helix domain-containing protein n=1 Tax=Listeria ivanovii TaxID=1638 RepID=UPI000DA74C6E|nr:helix-turn-helix transcriptional regulator [Listeria ivanovii]PZG33369.1 hypothetical protein C2D64_08480 [Listeria ivanovii]PZG47124.1 hypothetical protein C2D66_08240 [Listeria ivanovii]PZH11020.1 hypothetical protein C2D65_08430 [Listeria ivanovii]